jgi:hypothetical protein
MESSTWSALHTPYGRNLGFLDQSRYFYFQVAPQFSHEADQTLFGETHCRSRSRSAGKSKFWIMLKYILRNLSPYGCALKLAVSIRPNGEVL